MFWVALAFKSTRLTWVARLACQLLGEKTIGDATVFIKLYAKVDPISLKMFFRGTLRFTMRVIGITVIIKTASNMQGKTEENI